MKKCEMQKILSLFKQKVTVYLKYYETFFSSPSHISSPGFKISCDAQPKDVKIGTDTVFSCEITRKIISLRREDFVWKRNEDVIRQEDPK